MLGIDLRERKSMVSNRNFAADTNVDWVICDDAVSFRSYFSLWRQGWESAFERKLSESLLNRYFLNPPLDSPVMLIGLNRNKVVASSTLVPLSLVDPVSLQNITYFQYIAAFVLRGFSNGLNTYREMLKLVIEQVKRPGIEFLLSFPNENAKSIMVRVGGFKIIDVGYFIDGVMNSTIRDSLLSELSRPFFDRDLLRWRMHERMFVNEGRILSMYRGKNNLLDIVDESFSEEFKGLMPWWSSWGDSPYQPVDAHRVNMCVFSETESVNIKRSFLLSDIF